MNPFEAMNFGVFVRISDDNNSSLWCILATSDHSQIDPARQNKVMK